MCSIGFRVVSGLGFLQSSKVFLRCLEIVSGFRVLFGGCVLGLGFVWGLGFVRGLGIV